MLPVEKIYQSLEKDEAGFAFCPLMFDLEECMIVSNAENGCSIYRPEQQVLEEIQSLLSDGQKYSADFRELSNLLKSENRLDLHTYDHFEGQEKQLIDLATKYPDRIFPFFCRRSSPERIIR